MARVAGLLAMAVLAAGCSPAPIGVVTMTELAYTPEAIILPADKPGFPVRLVNAGAPPHDFSIDELGAATVVHPAVLPGVDVTYPLPVLPAGTYAVFCGAHGHREAGMHTPVMVR